MDLRQIQYFVALYEERSITRAAERMHLSQSAMSNALGRLREHLGARRHGIPVELAVQEPDPGGGLGGTAAAVAWNHFQNPAPPPPPPLPKPIEQPKDKPDEIATLKPAKFPFSQPPAEPEQPRAPFKSDRPAKEWSPGYFLRNVSGFRMSVSKFAYEESDSLDGAPLKILDDEINRLVGIFPEQVLKALRDVPIWVEWDHVLSGEKNALAVYYGGGGDLYFRGVDPRKADSICVMSLKRVHKLKTEKDIRQTYLLHEMAHAVHHQAHGRNPFIRNAYDQSRTRGLYLNARHDDGQVREAYAITNEWEYFAELTCAYLDRLDYYPHDAKELREYDTVGFELMTKAWGSLEMIEAARKKQLQKK